MLSSSSFSSHFLPLLLLALFSSSLAAPNFDLPFHHGGEIVELPDYHGPNLTQASGYITVDDVTNRSLFYWFIMSQDNPSKDPLVLWLQGGPGCSGLGGLLTENGPFSISADGLETNAWGWTSVANMLWIEAPAGVGFSYPGNGVNATNIRNNDTTTAADNLQFLKRFVQVYDDFVKRDFWITGESYGGIYVPTLSRAILEDKSMKDILTFKGFMAGNPVFGCVPEGLDYLAVQMNLFYWHGLVSYSNYNQWNNMGCNANSSVKGCYDLFNTTTNQIGVILQPLRHRYERSSSSLKLRALETDNLPSLDPDELYQDFCTGNGTLEFVIDDLDACQPIGFLAKAYLNRKDVQTALHITDSGFPVYHNWSLCADVGYEFGNEEQEDMNPVYQDIFRLKPDLHVLVYSGDVDIATVPFAETQYCLEQLNGTRTSDWGPWFVNGATAGYVETFSEYTYCTLKGAGHEAPQYQPKTSYNMFSRFLKHQNITWEVAEQKSSVADYTVRQGDVLRNLK